MVLLWQLYRGYLAAEGAVQSEVDAEIANLRAESALVVGELEETRSKRDKLRDEMASMRA